MPRRKSVGLILIMLLAGVAVYSYLIGGKRLFFLDDRFYSVLGDDAMISMRFAYHWSEGFGIFWNKGGSVEGYSNYAWVLMMTLVHHLVPSIQYASLGVICLSVITVAGAIYFTFRLTEILTHSSVAGLIAALAVALAKPLIVWTAEGFEVGLLTMVFCATLLCLIQRRFLLASVLMAVGVLTRDDFSVLVASQAVLFAVFFQSGERQRIRLTLQLSALPAAAFIGHGIWRYFYYGDFLPNTFYLKATGIGLLDKLGWGTAYVAGVLPVVALTCLGLYSVTRESEHQPTRATMLATIGSLMALCFYLIVVGGDAFEYARFFAPVYAVFAVGLGVCIHRWQLLRPVRMVWAVVLFGLFVSYPLHPKPHKFFVSTFSPITRFLTTADPGYLTPASLNSKIYKKVPNSVFNVISCLMIQDHASEHPALQKSMAVYFAGTSAYFCPEFYAVDLLGKCDGVIAKRPAGPGWLAHNKFDYEYSLSQHKTTYVVSLIGHVDQVHNKRYRERPADVRYPFHLLANSNAFRQCYLKDYIRQDKNPIFIRSCGAE